LRIFESVARHSSISRAAEELHLTQPAVSMQMKQLERLLGLPLIEQIGKQLFLTEAGIELRAHAEGFVAQMYELTQAIDEFRGLGRGIVNLAVISTANYFLPPLIGKLLERHPGMRINVRVLNREGVLAAIMDNRAELGITGPPPDTSNVVAVPFLDNPLVLIAPPTHRLAHCVAIPALELAREIFVVRELGSGLREAIEWHFAALGMKYLKGSEFNTNEAIKQAVQAGLGLSLVSRQTIDVELETQRLVVLPAEGFPIMRQWYVVQRRDKRLSAAAAACVELLICLSGRTKSRSPPSPHGV
jgi:DNA-binding transcriptional LysR family regulator